MLHLVRRLAALLLLVGALLLTGPVASAAGASSYVVDASLDSQGMLSVSSRITFDGAAPDSLTQRLANTHDAGDDRRYTYTITDVKAATAGGRDLQANVTQEGGYTVVRVATKDVSEPVVISYKVRGATAAMPDGGTKLEWRVLQGLSIPVAEVSGVVKAPGSARDYSCQAGPPAATVTCGTYSGGTHNSPNLEFTDGPRGVGEVVVPAIQWPSGVVPVTEQISRVWSLDNAFSPGLPQLLSALAALLLGGLLLFGVHRRSGRDVTADAATPVAEFVPVGAGESEFVVHDDVRPGHVGTVADEHVDQVDVLGSLLDLAVRGHLLITQLPRTADHDFTDWSITRRQGGGDVAPFEAALLNAIAPEGEAPTKVSNLAATIVPAVGAVQNALYDDVVARGWFSRRPDQTRSTWAKIGWAALAVAAVVAAVLVAFTNFGLLGLALIALALGLLFVAQEMPARTASGAALLAGLRSLSTTLDTQPTNQLPKGREYEQISTILPYAVVMGGWERWLDALVASDDDADADPEDLSWYHAPADWHLRDLPASLHAFATAVRGRLFAR